MRFSEKWLREWIDPPVSTEELAHWLTMAGLEVDALEPAAPDFAGIVVGEVTEVAAHPNADKLRLCRVSDGDDTVPVVCGAPNVRAGMKAPFARVGARLPDGTTLKKTKIRDAESQGMLCSARELGLSEHGEGLMALPASAPVGEDLRAWLGLDDAVIELDLTPNRGDCLGVAGIAREVGVLTDQAVGGPAIEPVPADTDDRFPVELTAPEGCPRYVGRVIRGVDVRAESPVWLQERLRRSGIRSLGPVVDVTNYVMLELGQPMHAFDLGRLERGIRVRWAQDGERLALLDGREVELDKETLVIADHARALAMAGVMGGEGSAVGEGTVDLFLESACFRPEAIAGRARRYGLHTDSSHRFERGVDPELPARAMERATRLLLEIVGGRAGPAVETSERSQLPVRPTITLRAARVRRVLGVDLDPGEIEGILARLGMAVDSTDDGWCVTPPAARYDLAIEADLIEELARIHGYERIPSHPPEAPLVIEPRSEERIGLERLRQALVDRGYQEAITYSFVDRELEERITPGTEPVALANPLSAEMAVMRTSLWPGLLRAVQHNRQRQQERVRLFESGLRFYIQCDEIKQENMIAGVALGAREPEQWSSDAPSVDFFDIKGDVEALFTLTGRGPEYIFESEEHPALHPGQSARIRRDGATVGWLGNLHPAITEQLDLTGDVMVFELRLDPIQQAAVPAFRPLSRFPAIRRDLAVVVDEAVPARDLEACAREAAGERLVELRLFDVYQGEGIETGRKSIALGLILQESSRTLTDEEADDVVARVTGALRERMGASLRE